MGEAIPSGDEGAVMQLELRDPTLYRRRRCAKRRRHGVKSRGSSLYRDRKRQVIDGRQARAWAKRQPFNDHPAEQRAAARIARRELGKKVYARYARLCSPAY